MSCDDTRPQRWRIGIRGILYFTTTIALSLGLLRFALATDFGYGRGIHPAQLFAILIGLLMFGGSFGGVGGQILRGSTLGVMVGFFLGGMMCLGGMIALAVLVYLSN
jgi:hypothetical protein